MSNQEPAPQVAQTQPPVKPQGKKPAPPPRARRNWDVEKRVFLLFAALSGFWWVALGAMAGHGLFSEGLHAEYFDKAHRYQIVHTLALLVLMTWLTAVWLLREILLGLKPKLRDGLYNATAPLISTSVVLLVLLIQLSPVGIMALAYSALVSVHILTEGFGMMLFGLLAASVLTLVLYWVTSTIIALVVVALPGMYPLRAIQAASDLVVGRRLRIMLRIVWAFVYSSVIWCVVMVSLVLLERGLSSKLKWLESVPIVPFAGAFMMALLFVWLAAYIYLLYRKVVADDAKPA